MTENFYYKELKPEPIPNNELIKILNYKDELIEFFRHNRELMQTPYRIFTEKRSYNIFDQERWDRDKKFGFRNPTVSIEDMRAYDYTTNKYETVIFVKSSIFDNTIYNFVERSGFVSIFKDPISTFTFWKSVDFSELNDVKLEQKGYALVDLALYSIRLLNLYIPNRPIIKNIYLSNVREDAFGQESTISAERAITKLLKRTQRDIYCSYEQEAKHIVHWAKAELSAFSENATGRRDGVAFEQLCKTLLEKAGFEVHCTPVTGDFGADLIAHNHGLSYAIQCKDTIRPVGIKAIQEAIGSQRHYQTDYAVVCCSSEFTDAAINLATTNKVIICHSDNLVKSL